MTTRTRASAASYPCHRRVTNARFHGVKSGVKRVEALARGLMVLKAIYARPGASLHELHGSTGVAKATLLRSLRTLQDGGFISRRLADGGYLPLPMAQDGAQWLAFTEAAGPAL